MSDSAAASRLFTPSYLRQPSPTRRLLRPVLRPVARRSAPTSRRTETAEDRHGTPENTVAGLAEQILRNRRPAAHRHGVDSVGTCNARLSIENHRLETLERFCIQCKMFSPASSTHDSGMIAVVQIPLPAGKLFGRSCDIFMTCCNIGHETTGWKSLPAGRSLQQDGNERPVPSVLAEAGWRSTAAGLGRQASGSSTNIQQPADTRQPCRRCHFAAIVR